MLGRQRDSRSRRRAGNADATRTLTEYRSMRYCCAHQPSRAQGPRTAGTTARRGNDQQGVDAGEEASALDGLTLAPSCASGAALAESRAAINSRARWTRSASSNAPIGASIQPSRSCLATKISRRVGREEFEERLVRREDAADGRASVVLAPRTPRCCRRRRDLTIVPRRASASCVQAGRGLSAARFSLGREYCRERGSGRQRVDPAKQRLRRADVPRRPAPRKSCAAAPRCSIESAAAGRVGAHERPSIRPSASSVKQSEYTSICFAAYEDRSAGCQRPATRRHARRGLVDHIASGEVRPAT